MARSPVPGREPPIKRSTAIALSALLAVVTAALLVVFVVRLASTGDAEANLGDPVLELGRADSLARAIERDRTPLVFQDLLQRSRDLFVQHEGADPATGWRAFEAHAPDQPRTCQLRWDADARRFADPCTGATYPPDGAGLTQYRTEVRDNRLVVDLRAPPPG